ncbi:hypothetical protein Tco_1552227 [Tanacetum coccineum]
MHRNAVECEDDFEIVKVRDHVDFYVVGKDGTRTCLWQKAGFDVRRGREYKAVGFGDATTKYFHSTTEGFLSNPKEKSGVKSLDVDISEHSEVSDGFEGLQILRKHKLGGSLHLGVDV